MNSSLAFTNQSQNFEREDGSLSISKRPSSRRSQSFSSSSSSSLSLSCSSPFRSSWNMEDSPLSPTTALQFSGIPFSWEQQPGVPKKHTLSHSSSQKKKDPSLVLLPLPPAATPIASKGFNYEEMFPIRKKNSNERSKRDPFIGALVKCSKDDYWKTTKVSRLLSDRFAFIDLNVSCKRSCAVSESTIFIPRSTRTTYDLLNRRSG